jgi:hypothetical protein
MVYTTTGWATLRVFLCSTKSDRRPMIGTAPELPVSFSLGGGIDQRE